MREQSSNGMSCEFFEENLSNLLEGHVTLVLRDELNLHLGNCVDCRELRDSVTETVFACRSLSDEAVPSSRLGSNLVAILQNNSAVDCASFELKLSDLLEDSLGDGVRAGLLSHRDTCAECRSLFDLTSRSLRELDALAKSPAPMRRSLTDRLSQIPRTESRAGFISFVRSGLRGVNDALDALTSSPVLTQTVAIVLLVASAAVFIGIPSTTDDRSAPTIAKGYDMVVKTYNDGSDAVLSAIDIGGSESNGGGDR